MKTGKKILIAAICAALVIAGIVGYKMYNDSKIVVNVSSVQMMSGGYFEDPLTTSGMVYDMENQVVDVDYQKVIKDVFVEEGQEVKQGDPLVEYDITSLQLSLELKKLEIDSLQNEIEKAQRDLRKLRNTTPVPEYNPDPEPAPVPTPLPVKTPKQNKDAWDFLNSMKQAVNYVKESAAHVTVHQMAPWKEENPEPVNPEQGNEDPEPVDPEPSEPEVTTYHLSLTNCSTTVTYTYDDGEHEMEVAEYDFEPGTEIVVKYAQDQENDEFAYWKILNLDYQNSAYAEITFKMPEHDVNIVAVYDRYYTVNVENGTADKDKVFAGTTVTVTYTGEDQFKEWSSADEDVSFAYAKNQQTTFTMPEHDVNIKAKTDKDDKDPEPTPTPEPDKPGTEKNPYKFLIQETGYVTGSFLNELREMGEDVYAEIYTSEDDTWKGKTTRVAKLCSSSLVQVDDESMWSIPDRMVHFDEEDIVDIDGGYTEISIPESGYTARDLQRAIGAAERQLVSLDLSKRKADLELKELEEQLSDGIVRAKRNGVVKTVHTPDDIPNDGTPFLEVVSGNGIYIQGSISELLLDKVEPGQAVYAMSWEDGNSYEGEIVSIDDWPTNNNMYWGGGNPNVSYYSFQAYVEDAGTLKSGNYLQLNFGSAPGSSDQIIISSAYVRDEKGKKYVMKDDNGRLVKQYVKTGKTYWGTMIEILEGITLEDYIAFPYGDGAKEGAKTKQDEMGGYY